MEEQISKLRLTNTGKDYLFSLLFTTIAICSNDNNLLTGIHCGSLTANNMNQFRLLLSDQASLCLLL